MKLEDLTPEQKEKALACKTTEELIALARAEGVELTDKVTLCRSADRRVARAVAHGVHVDCKYSCAAAKACGGKRGFDSGVSRADNCYIIISCKVCHV